MGISHASAPTQPLLLRAGDPRLAPDRSPTRAAAFVAALHADTPALRAARWRTLEFIGRHPDALLRTCTKGHITASALVVDHARARALLLRHRKLQRWLQPGGHADGDGNLVAVALREATEESGLPEGALEIETAPIDLDIHAVAPPGELPHLHFDLRFLVRAPAGAELRGNHESEALGWYAPEELSALDTDESTRRLARRGFELAARLWP